MKDFADSREENFTGVTLNNYRNGVIDQLKLNFAHDNLDVEDFEGRLSAATNSDDKRELAALIKDLPTLQEQIPEAHTTGLMINTGKIKREETILAVLSGPERKGVWNPPKSMKIAAFMGGADLDFTKARLVPGVMEIDIFCMMGGVDIIVPEGVNVEVSGLPIMGGFDNKTSDVHHPDAPTIRVRGVVIMGGVDIKYPKKRRKALWGRKR